MTQSKSEIKEQNRLLSEVRKKFPQFPVRLYESPSDQRCLWVKVFVVPEELHEKVEDFIVSLQDRYEKCLLPNVISTMGYEDGKIGYYHNLKRSKKRRMQRMTATSR